MLRETVFVAFPCVDLTMYYHYISFAKCFNKNWPFRLSVRFFGETGGMGVEN